VGKEEERSATMNAVHVGSGAPGTSSPPQTGARESRIARYFLLWLLAAPFLGFVLAGRVFDLGAQGDWEVWKAAMIGGLLAIPFVVGTYFGVRSVLKGFSGGWIGLVGNVALGLLAIVMPIFEALTD
jgi:hypothetical protein